MKLFHKSLLGLVLGFMLSLGLTVPCSAVGTTGENGFVWDTDLSFASDVAANNTGDLTSGFISRASDGTFMLSNYVYDEVSNTAVLTPVSTLSGFFTKVTSYCCEATKKLRDENWVSVDTVPVVNVYYTKWGATSCVAIKDSVTKEVIGWDCGSISKVHSSTGSCWFRDSASILKTQPLIALNTTTTDPVVICVTVGDVKYQFYSFYGYSFHTEESGYLRSSNAGTWHTAGHHLRFGSQYKYAFDSQALKLQFEEYETYRTFLSAIQDAALKGVVAGSIGLGYNVGMPYSTSQKPLSDLVDTTTKVHDFLPGVDVDYTLDYYYSPLFGKLYAVEGEGRRVIPKTDDDWIALANSTKTSWLSGTSLIVDEGFVKFAATLTDTGVNSRGEKIVPDIRIEGGASRMNLNGSEDPQSVLSYMVPLGVPYSWNVSGGVAQLFTQYLRILDGFVYCIYDDQIYADSGTERTVVTHMSACYPDSSESYLSKVYLFSRLVDVNSGGVTKSVRQGLVIPGSFDEVVVDTTQDYSYDASTACSSLFLTGRMITFDGRYSDALKLDTVNSSLMRSNRRCMAQNESGYMPCNVFFPATAGAIDLKAAAESLSLIVAEVVKEDTGVDLGDETTKVLRSPVSSEFYEYFNNAVYHGEIPDSCPLAYTFIDFGVVGKDEKSGTTLWRFFIVRNNAYVNDADLLSWLRHDDAQSVQGVYADKLYAKITGDFSSSITGPTYQDWLKMQDIKDELDDYRGSWLMRVVRVVCIVLGVVFILLAILYMVAYWFDIWNTFSGFSLLGALSLGRMCSVSDMSLVSGSGVTSGNVRFMDFKRMCFMCFVLLVLGMLFLNITPVVDGIYNVYRFFLYKVSGKAW